MVRIKSLLVASAISALFAVTAVTGIAGGAANAQQPGTPTVTAFLADPEQLLLLNPNGGPLLANAVQQLLLLDSATFKVIISLLPNANELQKIAIAQGLAQAAKIEVLTDQELAQEWQGQILEISEPTFRAAAVSAFGDVQIGVVGGAAGGDAGAGLGGPGGGRGVGGAKGAGGRESFEYNPVHTSAFTFTGGTISSGGYSTTTTTNPVSPSRN